MVVVRVGGLLLFLLLLFAMLVSGFRVVLRGKVLPQWEVASVRAPFGKFVAFLFSHPLLSPPG